MGGNAFRSFPLAPFERYMLMDDTHAYSMTCHIRIWFDGEFHKPAFRESLQRTLEQHPLLRCKLHRHPGRFGFEKMTFDEAPIIIDEILDWGTFETPIASASLQRWDLRTRFFVRASGGKSLLVIRFHHAISDGQGIYGFVEDFLQGYDALCNGKAFVQVLRNPRLLKKRANMGLSQWQWLRRIHLDVRRFLKFVTSFPVPMTATRLLPEDAPAQLEACLRVVVPKDSLEVFKDHAKALRTTFNELLIARLFQRAVSWNTAKGLNSNQRKVYRMNVPISLREKGDEAMSAANFVSMVFLDRTAGEIANEPELARSIKSEMEHIKKNRMGLTLIRSITAMTRVNFFQRFLRLPLCMATVGLTNLGRPFFDSKLKCPDGTIRSGNVTITGTDTLPPLRHLTRVLISANRFNDDLSLTLRWDSRTIAEADARTFLSGFISSLVNPQNSLATCNVPEITAPSSLLIPQRTGPF